MTYKVAFSSILTSALFFAGCVLEKVPPTPITWYQDSDNDGFGDPAVDFIGDNPGTGWVQNNTDCNDSVDTGTAINPSATDVNDQIDNNCDGTVNDAPFALGDYGQAGGTVFYIINDGLNGLEASPEDQDKGSGAEWGCFSTDVPGAAGQEIGDGEKNTADILAAKCTPENIDNHLAAELADNYSLNGYNDWFLPSKGEMNALYAQKSIIPNLTLACYYWSSNKDITIYAQGLCLQSGVWNGSGRSSTHRVRAIRAF